MTAGRILWADVQRAFDANGSPQAGSTLSVYLNRTTLLAPIYADKALTTTIGNPQTANAAGLFFQQARAIWADVQGIYSLKVSLPDGTSYTVDDISPIFGAADLSGVVIGESLNGLLYAPNEGVISGVPAGQTLYQVAAANSAALAAMVAKAVMLGLSGVSFAAGSIIYHGGFNQGSGFKVVGTTGPFIMDMQGSTLVYVQPTGAGAYLPDATIESVGNADIEWRDLAFSMTPLPWSQGVVTAFDNTANTITFTADAGFLPTATTAMIVDKADLVERAVVATIGSGSVNYALTSNGGASYTIAMASGVTPGATNEVSTLALSVGAKIIVRHVKYGSVGFASSGDTKIKCSLTCNASAGLATRFLNCGSVDNEIEYIPPAGGLIASNADGGQVINCYGDLRWNGYGSGIGDDALNVKGALWLLTSSTANSVTGDFGYPGSSAYFDGYPPTPKVGDVAWIINATTMAITPLTVQSVVYVGAGPAPSQILTVTFTTNLPAGFAIGAPWDVYDVTQLPTSAEIKIATLGYVVGRSLLCQVGNADIEVDAFGCTYAGIQIGSGGTAVSTGEASAPSHVSLRGSARNCGYYEGSGTGYSAGLLLAAATAESDIRVTSFDMARIGFGGIWLQNVADAVLDGVTMTDVGRLRSSDSTLPSGNDLYIQNSNVVVQDLTRVDAVGSIYIADTTSNVKLSQ